jgi:hypothetical protein
MTVKAILKQWFSTGNKPTQGQFWEWMDSYWHKTDDEIGIANINGLAQILGNKVDGPLTTYFVGKFESLAELQASFPQGQDGFYAVVAGEEYIWNSDSSTWVPPVALTASSVNAAIFDNMQIGSLDYPNVLASYDFNTGKFSALPGLLQHNQSTGFYDAGSAVWNFVSGIQAQAPSHFYNGLYAQNALYANSSIYYPNSQNYRNISPSDLLFYKQADDRTGEINAIYASALASLYLPYSGAQQNVDLGSNTIVADNLSGTNTGDQDLSSYARLDGGSGGQTIINSQLQTSNYGAGIIIIGGNQFIFSLNGVSQTLLQNALSTGGNFYMPLNPGTLAIDEEVVHSHGYDSQIVQGALNLSGAISTNVGSNYSTLAGTFWQASDNFILLDDGLGNVKIASDGIFDVASTNGMGGGYDEIQFMGGVIQRKSDAKNVIFQGDSLSSLHNDYGYLQISGTNGFMYLSDQFQIGTRDYIKFLINGVEMLTIADGNNGWNVLHDTWTATGVLQANNAPYLPNHVVRLADINNPTVSPADADFDVSSNTIYTLPVITANRNIVFAYPDGAPNFQTAKQIKFWNKNTSGFSWHFSGDYAVKDPAGNRVTALANNTFYTIQSDGNDWVVTSVQGAL